MSNALVLAGGGVAGIAWELGVLRGIADVDPALAEQVLAADLIVGTSAGSSVAAQITSGIPLDELYEAQLRPETAEIEVDVNTEELFAKYGAALADASGVEDARRRLGQLALAAQTVHPSVRLAAIDARLPVKSWPDRDMRLPAVDAETGEAAVFTRESGVTLLDAVAASCAVPGVWPPVGIGDRHYVDGGVRSMTNADLAAGADRVLIIQPVLRDAPQPWGDLNAEIAALAPAAVHVISADQASVDAFGTNALSPATRAAPARAGRAVGAAHAAAVAERWG
ncbi:patatin-like phospholipase family protein [Micromonospora sp. DR5-3]|uniref:patatin-like phospholipase family protein n=1 Tax=unclassified Micromonospora TaxID=2617518 RepID=UPI0011D338D9|nr:MULTISPECIES: patatin-like phospholipase family protein [unclassified Micromonospora]MCW3814556.1 patatin-like phospholipase family protein [Micromonospora sp. DR5-3]TYC23250.1 patatin-like phospholipase family protein [Micromonospora sp. MP36]